MNSLDRLRAAKSELEEARNFIAKIGRPISEEPGAPCHTLAAIGVDIRISAPEWRTQIGRSLYCGLLDVALGEVIKERFGDLTKAALARMEAVVEQRRLDAEAELKELGA